MKAFWQISSLFFAFLLSLPAWAAAEDFRVETDVFVSEEGQPIEETLTLFFGDVVYDFLLSEPREVTVFDVRRGRIVLLDPERKVRTTVTTKELLEFTAAIKARSGQNEGEPLFGVDFASEVDTETGEIVLTGTNLTYRASAEADEHTEETKRFYAFADWYARLNAIRPGNPPPFARLRLNRELASKQLLPRKIQRTLTIPGRFRDEQHEAFSRHTFTWSLSTTDRKRIDDTGTHMASYQPLGLGEYWQVTRVAEK